MHLTYDIFPSHVTAFSTERGAGCDVHSPYSGFNINPYCGDDSAHVSACRRSLCDGFGIGDDRLLLPRQVHDVRVANIDSGDSLDGADALTTARRRVCIGVSTADCIPVLLHDTRHDAVAAVHSGWRGTVRHITALTLQAMQRDYGTCREDVVAVIGPGIRLDAFEVGDEVYETFRCSGFDMELIARLFHRPDGTARWHIDLPRAVAADLDGVFRVYDCALCTHTLHHRFFSARRLGINSGRIYTAIMLS